MKNLILASTSSLYGDSYLNYLLTTLSNHFKPGQTVLFIPYARPGGISHDEYTKDVQAVFKKIKIQIESIHNFENPINAIKQAKGIFIGGGNTFLLVTQLYKYKLLESLIEMIKKGIPYLGTSAGTNICGLTMQTTNDMPIIYPPSFKTLGILPFNLNPHYLDPNLISNHNGETRETRIKEFHQFNNVPVLGLREGSWLNIKGNNIILKGDLNARLFRRNQTAEEIHSETDIFNILF